MRVFFVFIYSFTTFLSLECTSNSNVSLIVNPSGAVIGLGPPILIRKVDDPLNLTCRLINHRHEILPNYNISWNWQYSMGSNANRVMVLSLSRNEANLVFESLKETDSGEYTCKCNELNLYKNVRVKVKAFKKYCSDKFFECSTGNCIAKHYMCDGKFDCKLKDDESDENCGPNPCEGKILCDDGRCIPTSWCCDKDHDLNCTTKVKLPCCQQLLKSYVHDPTFAAEQQFNDMGFLQTTIYTVIGCAMAFMFIVTILVIAICRVHLKRTVISRCPLSHQHLRPGSPLRSTLPLYDIDLFLDRRQDSGGLLVTYNINNGVQFVGRPVDPPPYCEVVDTPPREGPPPPYVSRENLTSTQVEEQESSSNSEAVSNLEPNNTTETSKLLATNQASNNDLVQAEIRTTQVPQEVVSNLKGLTSKTKLFDRSNEDVGLVNLFEICDFESNNIEDTTRNQGTSSLSDVSKFTTDQPPTNFDTYASVPSVSGLSKIQNKNLKRNVFNDFSDSESDSSCMENDGLLTGKCDRKNSDNNIEDFKCRSSSLGRSNENSSSGSFINNIAIVSKNLIGSLSKKQPLEPDLKVKNEKLSKVTSGKPFRPLLTQKSFDSSDRCRKNLSTNAAKNNFDKIVPNITHSMGDLSPVNSELNYNNFDRDFLTLPLRESFIGVRDEEK